jgi:FkbM family methyltransferase
LARNTFGRLVAIVKAFRSFLQLAVLKPPVYVGEGEIFLQTRRFPMYVPGWDLSLTPQILLHRDWEGPLSSHLASLLSQGDVVFDVGANIGWFSSLFAVQGACVHAFEPNPRLQKYLRKNLFLNAFHNAPRCSVNQVAVSEQEGTVSMRFPQWLAGGADLHSADPSQFLDSLIEEPVDTQVVTIDQFCSGRGIEQVRLIKMDIEGHEEQAVRGALELIARSPGLILSIEYTRGRYSDAFPGLLFSLFRRAYAPVFRQQMNLPMLVDYERTDLHPTYPFIDLVFEK